jgi:hypothetical protein
LALSAPLLAHAASVPFVPCASSGQLTTRAAPHGDSRSLPISARAAEALAYYESADGIGALGPRGWYCEGVSGSSGFALFLAPRPIHDFSMGGLEGPAIEINHITSENSGKIEIAEIMERVFPAYRAFATSVLKGMDLPIPDGPYPKDILIHKSKTIAEYTTPAQTEGLGNTGSWLGKNGLPINGAAILVSRPLAERYGPDLVLLSVRLPRDLAHLTPVIIRQTELAARQK